ncbi:MAG: glycoside hydrolase family 18 protein [Bacilli bacterium]
MRYCKLLLTLLITTTALFGLKPILAKADNFRTIAYYYTDEDTPIASIPFSKISHINYLAAKIYHREEGSSPNDETYTFDKRKLFTLYLDEKTKIDLQELQQLKEQNGNFKTILTIGGWGVRGFSEALSTHETRTILVNNIKQVVDTYGLDGVTIAWEYPTSGGWGVIQSSQDDKTNYTYFLEQLRKTMGNDFSISIIGAANHDYLTKWVDLPAMLPYIDFVEVLAFDFAFNTAYHNANLFASKQFSDILEVDNYTVEKVIARYMEELNKANALHNTNLTSQSLQLTIPAFGRIPARNIEPSIDWEGGRHIETTPTFDPSTFPEGDLGKNIFSYATIRKMVEHDDDLRLMWDEEAKVPYIEATNKDGLSDFMLSYENGMSAREKVKFARDKALGGVSLWSLNDDYKGELLATFVLPTTPEPIVEQTTLDRNTIIEALFVLLLISAFVLILMIVIKKRRNAKK